jgi:hypothetical protein
VVTANLKLNEMLECLSLQYRILQNMRGKWNKEFEEFFRAVEFLKQTIMDADPKLDWSMQICWDVDKVLSIYQHMSEDIKRAKIVQSMLLNYFERQ